MPSIIVDGVGKKFGRSLTSALRYGLADSVQRIFGGPTDSRLRAEEFWAIQNINFSLEPGDALGIMGVNGSGKTTLLRILNGTYRPNTGKVTLRGKVGALIAAGAGFSPMLSGRENIYISGALLGMTPKDIGNKFDEIVAFSELEEFIDMPVRNYSSGMSVRLGFAIAVIGAPEILLVDEVLAVGDISFQKKCFEKIHELKNNGVTILLVSHSPGQVWSVCNKGLVLHQGKTTGIISVEEACKSYEHNNSLQRSNHIDAVNSTKLSNNYESSTGGSGTVFIIKVEVLDEDANPIVAIGYSKGFILRYHIIVKERIEKGILRTLIDSEIHKAISVIDNYETHRKFIDLKKGSHTLDIKVQSPNLRPGSYQFSAAILNKDAGVHLFYAQNHAALIIEQPKDIFFYADFRASVQMNAQYSNLR